MSDSDLEVLVQNGLDKETALAALHVYGSAEKVLLVHVCGEDVVEDSRVNESFPTAGLDGDRFDAFVSSTRNLSWQGVDLRRGQPSEEFSASIVSLGANFLRQACVVAESNSGGDAEENVKQIHENAVKQIVELGFSAEQAHRALQNTRFNLEQAISQLLDDHQ